jgi:hypothetical protein
MLEVLPVRLGSTSVILSFTAMSYNAVKWYVSEVAMLVTVRLKESVSELTYVIAGDIGIEVASTSVAPASVSATVRVLRFAACGVAGALRPVATRNEHAVVAASAASPAVITREAIAWPWFKSTPEKWVVPHCVVIIATAPLVPLSDGSTSVILSPGSIVIAAVNA